MAPHLERAELEQRYRQATNRVARSQWQIIWLLAQGQSTQSVVQATGFLRNLDRHDCQSATTVMLQMVSAIDGTPISWCSITPLRRAGR